MRLVEPAHNVELRADRHGHEHVVFAFPYRADIVDAVRAIPGRRFDWDAKEWWAPQADSTAPYVKGVIERHPSLLVAPDVDRVAGRGDERLGRARRRGAAERARRVRARDDLGRAAGRARRGRRGARRAAVAAVLAGDRRGAAGAARRAARQARAALRDAAAGRPGAGAGDAGAGRQRRRAALHARRQLGPRHDPRVPRAAGLRGARPLAADRPLPRRAARALPAHVRRRGRAQRRRGARAPARRARRGDRGRAPLARARRARRWRPRRRSAASCARSSAPASRTCCARGGRSSPTSRASARPSRRSPRWRRTAPIPRDRDLPGVAEAQLAARGASTGCRTARWPSCRAPAPSRPPPT